MTRLHDSDPTYPLFPIFAFVGFFVSLVPLPWHLQAWNSGTCWYMFWASLSCLNQFVNSVVWAGNVFNSAPAWCEISIRIMMGATVGLPAASLCINRRLYHIATMQTVVITKADKRRAVLIDSLICGLFPAVYIALQYVVQGHRFNIFEDIGCYPAVLNTLPAYFTTCMWPFVLGLISSIYCILSLRAFAARRAAFAQLMSTHPALTPARYLRLSALALTDLMLSTPLAAFTIYLNTVASPISPWISWADTHFDYGRIEQVPHVLWAANTNSRVAIELARWAPPMYALVFFALFGFAEEARRNYALFGGAVGAAFWKGLGFVGVRRPHTGVFAAKSTTSFTSASGSKGIGYTKPAPPSFAKSGSGIDISLPAYTPSGSFTAASFDTDLKRARSFASSARTTTSTARTASSSRFVEGFEKDTGDVVSVSSVYSADGHVDAHASIASSLAAASAPSPFHSTFHPDPETPASATSFATSTSSGSGSTRASDVLPLHLGWAEHAYPASPTSAGHYTTDGEGEGEWTPTSDAYSIRMAAYPHEEEEQVQAERGPHARSLV